ncbi:MAG TPA: nucleoside hydrolase [Fastidiosipila sp.]|jgi:inosine-uridine nucleoside N-ribohydrolase|nr:nucleoside hydrolase [Eubacteriales bacterium]HHU04031.1 nucleoside hydrolase [Fastidiosipila sp.]
MTTMKVWLDADPGIDDAAAILLAAKMPEIEIVGVSACAGNVELKYTYENARNLITYAGLDVPVYKGAEQPLLAEPYFAREIHGENGLGGQTLTPSNAQHEDLPAWDAIYQAASDYEDLTFVMIGPLTNLAIALLKYADLKQKIKRVVLMGGAVSYGNTTPSAEFNIYFDPEAADIVFSSDLDIAMLGLDVTMQASLKAQDIEQLGNVNEQGAFLAKSMQQTLTWAEKLFGLDFVAMHDPCTFLYLVYPELFYSEKAGVKIETKGKLTRGKTVSDVYSDFHFQDRTVDVVLAVDRDRFFERFLEIIGRY